MRNAIICVLAGCAAFGVTGCSAAGEPCETTCTATDDCPWAYRCEDGCCTNTCRDSSDCTHCPYAPCGGPYCDTAEGVCRCETGSDGGCTHDGDGSGDEDIPQDAGGDPGADAGGDSGRDAGADPMADGGDTGADSGDAGDPDGPADCGFDPEVSWTMLGEILQMESADGATCVWLEREDLCPPDWICQGHPFALHRIRIGHDGVVIEIDDPSRLSWTETHHNWSDTGHAATDTTSYTLQGVDYGQAYELTAQGEENWGPVLLTPWSP